MNESTEDNEDNCEETLTKPENISPGRVILILLAIALIIEVMTIISELAAPQSVYRYEYGYDNGEYFPDTDEFGWGEVEYPDDDEVIAAGTACDQLGHFDFTAVSLLDDLYDILKEQDLDVREIDTSSFNEVFEDGGSWYETLITFSLDVPGDDTDYQRLTLNYDTATGALHEIDLFLSDEDRLLSLVRALLTMLNERTETFANNSCEAAVETLRRSIDRGENLYATYQDPQSSAYLAVTLYCYEDGYSVFIGRE